ncbi:hypothetical protein [Acetanaerobacterium elongatum]|uniref:Uncharacterized protein n=1 Tax=Acetanaerobacterium elongatum TaxID=258515 RepID=A0A1H0ELU8_9FIRM|nr:hypothetical protein [Acetanaerobacterium elongatum]SDN83342.1 hypothetical protein SAMN05192585_13428 [Acetanaerobacterium elongatum]
MQTEEILRQFALLAGLTPKEAQNYQALAELIQTETAGRVRPNTNLAANAQRLNMLCAAGLCCRYVLLKSAQGGGSVTLGDVSVHSAPQQEAEAARRLLQEYAAACADILADDGFVFEQVKV